MINSMKMHPYRCKITNPQPPPELLKKFEE
jgi:hypothetical protein